VNIQMSIRQLISIKMVVAIATAKLFVFSPLCANAADATEDQVFARYARYGADVWATNPSANISGEGKACISCHTSLPYSMVEPLLSEKYPAYTDLIQNINERVRTWQQNTPWYSDEKAELAAELGSLPKDALKDVFDAEGSRGVESIFNAFILTMHDAYKQAPAQHETRQAFQNMWSEQLKSGAAAGSWRWIKANLVPWEVEDSDLWGASLACIAASQYPELAPPDNLDLLYSRLRKGAVDSNTSLHVKAAILWCDSEINGALIEAGVSKKIVTELLELQHSNGAWAIRELGPWGKWEGSSADCCARLEIRTDAYATGFITLVLTRHQQLGLNKGNSRLSRAVAWIKKELNNPYPAEPRINRHESTSEEFPQFRNNIYTNAGHMWAFLAKTVYEEGKSPWEKRSRTASRSR